MSSIEDAKGPYIRWENHGYEGWHPQSFNTLKEAVEVAPTYNSEFVITKLTEYVVKEKWDLKCNNCGKFISRKQIENKEARFHFIPDNEFGPEESYWEHIKC